MDIISVSCDSMSKILFGNKKLLVLPCANQDLSEAYDEYSYYKESDRIVITDGVRTADVYNIAITRLKRINPRNYEDMGIGVKLPKVMRDDENLVLASWENKVRAEFSLAWDMYVTHTYLEKGSGFLYKKNPFVLLFSTSPKVKI